MNKIYAVVIRFLLFLLLFGPAVTRAASPTVVLRFRYWGDFKEIAVIQKTIDAFEQAHPGVTVHGERDIKRG